jgi:hypothetical protein
MSRLTLFLRRFPASRNRAKARIPPGPPILFLHMPKTAGTSFRRMLQASLGMNAVYPSDEELSIRPNGWYPSEAEILETLPSVRRYFCITGHFSAAIADRLPKRHRTAVFLRDPIERSLSTLAHFYHTTGTPPARLLDDEAFVTRCIHNRQTILLGSEGFHTPPAGDTRILDRALNVVDAFDFVGLTERFRESCMLFDSTFGTIIGAAVQKENVLRPNGTEFSELLPRILPLIDLDRVLYDRARERFKIDIQRLQTATTLMHRAA